MRMLRRAIPARAAALAFVAVLATPAQAQLLPGDLDGDGDVDAADEAVLRPLYGAASGDPGYEPSADLDADGEVGLADLALFGSGFGATGGAVDGAAPGLLATVNHIPDDMNDLIVVPPDRFQITLEFSSNGGSAIDTRSLEITSNLDIGPHPAGTDLAGEFSVTPAGAVWEIPAGSDLARTTHGYTATIYDLAGNSRTRSYSFAVRDFAFGEPLGNLQSIFLDFDQDRGNGTFTDDLREVGLYSPLAPEIEETTRAAIIDEIVRRVNRYYGRNDDGSPGPDAANIVFSSVEPVELHTRICVGGESPASGAALGSANLDVHNLDEFTDECSMGPEFGVFPQAIDDLWGSDPGYIEAFDGVDPDLGGTPVGEHPLDASLLAPGFDPANANLAQLSRLISVLEAVGAFSQIVATGIAHETGHTLGLTAPGPAPGGLFGGTSGGKLDHNVTPGGSTPAGNYLMNTGASFSFDEITGSGSESLPAFRPLSWAYLRGRVALDSQVTGLYPPPVLSSATPNPASFPQGQTTSLTLRGDGFIAPVLIELLPTSGGLPAPVHAASVVDPRTVTGTINKLLVVPDTYDVRFVNGDGQETDLPAGLVVR